jgi:Holliday junction resolvase-like predicted endonuclease
MGKHSFSFSDFWQSPKREKIGVSKFLATLFKCTDASAEILRYFHENHGKELISAIKENKVFKKREIFSIINEIFKDEPNFLKELSYWKACFESSDSELESVNVQFLSRYNFEQVLLFCGFYYEKVRISNKILRNTDSNFIQVISEILNFKLRKLRIQNAEIVSYYNEFQFVGEGLRILEKLITFGDSQLVQLFEIFETNVQLNDLYDRYCFQDFSLQFIDERIVKLRPNNIHSYLKYKNDGRKYPHWQNHYQNNFAIENPYIVEAIANAEISWYNKYGSLNTNINLSQYLDAGFPADIEIEGGKSIAAVHCFAILNSLSAWTNIRWNDLLENQILNGFKYEPYKIILETIGYNLHSLGNSILPVCNRVYSDLINKTAEILSFDESTGRSCLRILANNLVDPNRRIDLLETPFIKVGQNVYWIAGIFSNKNYCVSLQNLLLKSDGDIRALIGKQTEDNLVYWFKKNEFSIIQGHHYKDNKGEIDLLAYKDGHLYICEVKSTYTRIALKEISQYRNDEERGISKAINQLNRDIAYLRLFWDEIKIELGTTLSYDELNVIPLAVTSSLEEGEGKTIIAGLSSFIVSYFDMMVILSNRKALLWNITEMALQDKFFGNIPVRHMAAISGLEQNEQVARDIGEILAEYIDKKGPPINNDVWQEGTGLCSPKDLFDALNHGLVWDFLSKDDTISERRLVIGDNVLHFSD